MIFKYIILAHPWKRRFYHFICKTRCFDAFPKAIQIEHIQIRLFLPTPVSADLPILCAKLGVFMPCQKSFQTQDIQRYYSCLLLKAQILQFNVHANLIETRCFDAFPKAFRIEDSKIFKYIIPLHPCKARFFNFMCKTLCVEAFPKAF
jgi:hypothetical protein